jgi:dipeptidyl aminopeptidase/acylaminoacyl peptidase
MKYGMTPALIALLTVCAIQASADTPPLTLEKIMADPDWIGPPVQDAYWSLDGQSVYYSLRHPGASIVDLHRIALRDGKDSVVEGAQLAVADTAAIYDAAGKHAAFVRNGDIFVRELPDGALRQITRSPQPKVAVQFSADGRQLSYRVENDWFVHDFTSGVTAPAAIVKAEKDPNAAPDADDMREFQLRTFATLKRAHDRAEQQRQHDDLQRKADGTRVVAPFYVGDTVAVRATSLSPDARWMMVVTVPKAAVKGREGDLTHYVTESGYEELEKERLRVARNTPAGQTLWLLNLSDHSMHELKVDALPGIHDDPLRAVREQNAKGHSWVHAQSADAAKARAVWVVNDESDVNTPGMVWSSDSKSLAVEIFAMDNKDRWLVSVDFERYQLETQHRLSDQAWVNTSVFTDLGWLNDNRTLWFESEESGFGHLYIKKPGAAPIALTQGRFEVTHPVLSADGRWFYVLTNAIAPYSYDIFRLPSGGGPLQRVTQLAGVEHFVLQESGRQLLVVHSSAYVPTQISIVNADGSGKPRALSDTRTAEYKAMTWIAPEIVQVPSTHGGGVIYGKLYRDPSAAAAGTRPGVLFVHGAGYLQDVHLHYPYYFREQMFNNLLAHRGYAVLDLDYRASQGYGRDWRTAIYRQMGHPELEDMLDGKQWLAAHAGVDAKRVGVYGGSYGGFMTLMALFRAPGEFAAGAALRPVTDWMQYEHQYTSEILNEPQIDPIAYEQSSPIEFAAGLKDSLLICHGVIDDNVLFEDSMRLYQRLIELHKDDFSMSPYPLDRHGFSNADSWLDEYKRILRLFEATLNRP